MKVLTALANPLIQNRLKDLYPEIEFILDDLTYKDGVLDALKVSQLDSVIITTDIEGSYDRYEFINRIRSLNDVIKVILVEKSEDKEYANWLASKGVYDVFIDNNTDFEDIYEALRREQKVIVKTEIVKETVTEFIEKEKVIKVPQQVIEEKILGTATIAVYGSSRGSGCTKTAISIAHYVARLKNNFKVAIVELNNSGDFKRLGTVNNKHSLNTFMLNDVDFYYGIKAADVAAKGYNYIILDYGILFELDNEGKMIQDEKIGHSFSTNTENMAEFHRANIKICVCQSHPWQLDEIIYNLGYGKNFESWEEVSKDFNYCFTLTDPKEFKAFQANFDEKKMFLLPYMSNLFTVDDAFDDLMTELLQSVLPKTIEIRKGDNFKKYLKLSIEAGTALIFISLILLMLYFALVRLGYNPIPSFGEWINDITGSKLF